MTSPAPPTPPAPPAGDAEKTRDRQVLWRVAIVGALGVVIGALVASVSTYYAARVTADSQRQQSRDEFVRLQRQSVYSTYNIDSDLWRVALSSYRGEIHDVMVSRGTMKATPNEEEDQADKNESNIGNLLIIGSDELIAKGLEISKALGAYRSLLIAAQTNYDPSKVTAASIAEFSADAGRADADLVPLENAFAKAARDELTS